MIGLHSGYRPVEYFAANSRRLSGDSRNLVEFGRKSLMSAWHGTAEQENAMYAEYIRSRTRNSSVPGHAGRFDLSKFSIKGLWTKTDFGHFDLPAAKVMQIKVGVHFVLDEHGRDFSLPGMRLIANERMHSLGSDVYEVKDRFEKSISKTLNALPQYDVSAMSIQYDPGRLQGAADDERDRCHRFIAWMVLEKSEKIQPADRYRDFKVHLAFENSDSDEQALLGGLRTLRSQFGSDRAADPNLWITKSTLDMREARFPGISLNEKKFGFIATYLREKRVVPCSQQLVIPEPWIGVIGGEPAVEERRILEDRMGSSKRSIDRLDSMTFQYGWMGRRYGGSSPFGIFSALITPGARDGRIPDSFRYIKQSGPTGGAWSGSMEDEAFSGVIDEVQTDKGPNNQLSMVKTGYTFGNVSALSERTHRFTAMTYWEDKPNNSAAS